MYFTYWFLKMAIIISHSNDLHVVRYVRAAERS